MTWYKLDRQASVTLVPPCAWKAVGPLRRRRRPGVAASAARKAETRVAWDVGVLKLSLGMRRDARARLVPPICG